MRRLWQFFVGRRQFHEKSGKELYLRAGKTEFEIQKTRLQSKSSKP